jgi:hypothetical protein
MVYSLEKAFDVGFHDLTEFTVLKVEPQIANRFLGPSPRSVAITDRQKILLVDDSQQLGAGELYQLVFQSGYTQRAFTAVFLGDVAASDQFGPIAFRLQSLDQRLDVSGEILLIRLCGHFVHTAGGSLVQLSPAAAQYVAIQAPLEVPKTTVFAGLRPQCYSPQ